MLRWLWKIGEVYAFCNLTTQRIQVKAPLLWVVKNSQHPLTQEEAEALIKAARVENDGGDV